MMDATVQWPACLANSNDAGSDGMRRCDFFAAMNRATLADVAALSPEAAAEQKFHGRVPPPPLLSEGWDAVSFSHFLPRPELHRGYNLLQHFEGSDQLGDQVAELHQHVAGASVHVFGHTHFSIDTTIDGIRYVQSPLGNPHERQNGWQIKGKNLPTNRDALAPVWSPGSGATNRLYSYDIMGIYREFPCQDCA